MGTRKTGFAAVEDAGHSLVCAMRPRGYFGSGLCARRDPCGARCRFVTAGRAGRSPPDAMRPRG
ncbi:hypothetical protein A2U01_0044991, partial [Trifolium medium]|nr:hypothetical protein [Trifolium medium]